MNTKKPKSLPDKPSKLIRVALTDLEKCERSRKYKINMYDWHQPNGKCTVCLAGSVMAQHLKCDPGKRYDPWDGSFDVEDTRKLAALDYFRYGAIEAGLDEMRIGRPRPSGLPRHAKPEIQEYKDGPAKFKRDMRQLATLLAKHGL